MNEGIIYLGETKIFSTYTANSRYWQLEIEDENQDKTAFSFHQNLYRFLRIPFGLKNAPGTFEGTMDVILASIKWHFALVFLNDNVIFAKTPQKLIDHGKQVLTLL